MLQLTPVHDVCGGMYSKIGHLTVINCVSNARGFGTNKGIRGRSGAWSHTKLQFPSPATLMPSCNFNKLQMNTIMACGKFQLRF